MNKLCVVFDLDDTLYKEVNYLKSAYRFIAKKLATEHYTAERIFKVMIETYTAGGNAFSVIKNTLKTDISLESLLQWYRIHIPDIVLPEDSKILLDYLHDKNITIGILTDGRSITQRNKIESLGLNRYVPERNIVISEEFGSEKPCEANYAYFESIHPEIEKIMYVGDNPQKDFIAPNHLGWETIGLLDDGRNIHKQKPTYEETAPKIWISNLSEELIPLIDAILE